MEIELGGQEAAKKICKIIAEAAEKEGVPNVARLFGNAVFQSKIGCIITQEVQLAIASSVVKALDSELPGQNNAIATTKLHRA